MATSVRERTNKRNRGAFWPAKGGIVREDSLARGLVLGDTYTDPVERYYFNRRLTRLKPNLDRVAAADDEITGHANQGRHPDSDPSQFVGSYVVLVVLGSVVVPIIIFAFSPYALGH